MTPTDKQRLDCLSRRLWELHWYHHTQNLVNFVAVSSRRPDGKKVRVSARRAIDKLMAEKKSRLNK